jgi:uncharacterized protein DUF3810
MTLRIAQTGLVAVALAAAWLPIPPAAVEQWFSNGWYPGVQQLVTPISNLVPFAIFDLLVAGALVFVVATLWRGSVEARRRRRLSPLLQAGAAVCAFGAAVYLAFLLLWGFNYRRVPMHERLIVEDGLPDRAAVEKLLLDTIGQANRLHASAHHQGWRGDEWQDPMLKQAFAATQAALSDAPHARPGRLKRTIFGPYFRWTGVDGMVDPFALEVLANPDLLPFERPFVAAHEWAHLAGYADEAEANFVGWLTCVRGQAPAQYSGWLFLYWELGSQVTAADWGRLSPSLAEGPAKDVQAIVERVQRGRFPLLRRVSWRVYDQYLRANGVEEGVRSYGEVIDLILRARFDEGWLPVRRR